MIRLLLAILIIVCPAAAGEQQITVQCNGGYCLIEIAVLKALVEQAQMNCGPTR
jgi:hypothetical protein